VHTEFNIEGNPIQSFIDLVLEVKPEQVTLVPDAPDAITSDSGWDCKKHSEFLTEVITTFKKEGIRTSIFLDANPELVEAAAKTGTDRIELYTEPYASIYPSNPTKAIKDFIATAKRAEESGLGVNAGHDLSLENIAFFAKSIPNLLEVSIGHALICEAIYFGLDNVVNQYLHRLQHP
jgi:pyridoxine 5-phosphate synthase